MINLWGDQDPEIILINSPLYSYPEYTDVEGIFNPPLGLSYIASHLANSRYKIAIIDGENDRLSPKEIASTVNRLHPEWVGINLLTPSYNLTRETVAAISPSIRLLVGGPHATALPEQVLNDEVLGKGIVVRSEGELKVAALVKGNPLNQIAGISYRQKGKIVTNLDQPTNPEWAIQNLDSLELKRRYVPHHPYVDRSGNRRAYMITSRDCPFNCTFCAGARYASQGYRVRFRSPPSVVNEITTLVKRDGVNDVKLLDDLAIISEKRIRSIFGPLIEQGISRATGFRWRAHGRANIFARLSNGVLDIIKESGCSKLMFGVERGTLEDMQEIRKQITPEQVEITVTRLASRGINVVTYFMIGFPEETREQMQETLSFAHKLKCLAGMHEGELEIAAYKVRPYPGTAIYDQLLERGYSRDELLDYRLQENIGGRGFEGKGTLDLSLETQLSQVPREEEMEYLAELRLLGTHIHLPSKERKG